MTEELLKRLQSVEAEVETLKEKLNEVISCLADNELTRKSVVDYLYPEEEEEEEDKEKAEEKKSE
jgi:hypothetical protein